MKLAKSTRSQVKPARAWQRMLSGRRLDLLNPQPGDIEIEDIAHGLARVARWNGQTYGAHALSVAQHVLIVEDVAVSLNAEWPASYRLAALLHDAAEYVIGDLISPFKTAIGLDYKAFEIQLLDAIYARFSVPRPLPSEVESEIKRADRIAAYYEATRLAGFTPEEGLVYFGLPDGLAPEVVMRLEAICPLPAAEAQREFLSRYELLSRSL